MHTRDDIETALRQFADKRHAAIVCRFFKTASGEYGAGDCFLGIANPKVRLVVKEAWKQTSLEDALELARSPWHEVRLCALLIMVAHFERAYKRKDETTMRRIVDLYLSLHTYINNWDLVDLSAYKIVGRYEVLHPDFTLMDEWIAPGHTLWQQRIAMVATWWHAHEGIYNAIISRAEASLNTQHHLLHKAAGWMLREMYKHDAAGQQALEDFLQQHICQMSSIMLSYAMEKMLPSEKRYWREYRKTR